MYPSLGPSAPPFTLPADMRRNAAAKANTATRPSTRRNFLRSVHGSPQTPPPPSPRRLRRQRQRERGRRSRGPTSPAPLLPSSPSSSFFSIAAMELRSPSRLPPFILERLSPTREGEDTHHNFFVSDVEDVVEMLERPEIRKDTWNLHVVLSVGLLHRAGLNMPLPGRAEERALSEGRESRQVWLAVAERGGSGPRPAACKHRLVCLLLLRSVLGKTCFRIKVTRPSTRRRRRRRQRLRSTLIGRLPPSVRELGIME